jgi:hypothetical protein
LRQPRGEIGNPESSVGKRNLDPVARQHFEANDGLWGHGGYSSGAMGTAGAGTWHLSQFFISSSL